MNIETEHIYKGTKIVVIDAKCTSGKHLFGYRMDGIFGVIAYTTANQALDRAKSVVDNPQLVNQMLHPRIFEPKYTWFR